MMAEMKTGQDMDKAPWFVAAAVYGPKTQNAAVAVAYVYPEDAAPGFELDDFDTVRTVAELRKEPDMDVLYRTAWAAGLSMAQVFGEDAFQAWPDSDPAAPACAGPDGLDAFGYGVRIDAKEPDAGTKAVLETVRKMLEDDCRARLGLV